DKSIYNESLQEQFAQMQTKYESEKKQKENEILKKQTEIQKLNIERQSIVIVCTVIGLILLLTLAVLIYRGYREKKKDNEIIAAEKEKSEKLLLNILPEAVAADLKENGSTLPRIFNNVTVFFSDIVTFTDISSRMEPDVLISELNELFTAFDDIIEKNGCERIKTIGDAYLAVCGMPEENENHAENMIRAAKEIIQYLTKRNENGSFQWKIRVGIHSGKVVGGVVGVKKYIYDVFGDTINTCSRMESNSLPMKINVSEETYSTVKDKFNFTRRKPQEVKGKGKVRMYFVE
ncbi:MAG TPA: adenylate/guanylate cyclase domain-containing protein, partial [Leptospiraceae bacterium]|nr:adenylate/guanylate cyclase domain-containing protein [Leptospiraceae bacterium]